MQKPVHVIPLNDLINHLNDRCCECCPANYNGDGSLWVHRRLNLVEIVGVSFSK